jgi:hypothetical protein
MSGAVASRACPSELGGIVCRFLGVDRVVVSPLLKRIYYVGLGVIAAWAGFTMLQSLGMAIDHPGTGAVGFFIASAFVGFGTVAWRLACELALALLQILAG